MTRNTESVIERAALVRLEDFDFIAMLAERPRGMVLVTAYCTDIESHCEKLRRERDKHLQMQKPPRGAT